MFNRFFFLVPALSSYCAMLPQGGDAPKSRTYDQFLTEIFTKLNPCGGVAPHEDTAGDLAGFYNCFDMCNRYGYDFALANGCYNFTDAIAHGMFTQIWFDIPSIRDGNWPVLPGNFTVTECAAKCFEDYNCLAWTYGPPMNSTGPPVDPEHPDKLVNTDVVCRLITLGMLTEEYRTQTRRQPDGSFGDCDGYHYSILNNTWSDFELPDIEDKYSLAYRCSIGAFITYRPLSENCRFFDPVGFVDVPVPWPTTTASPTTTSTNPTIPGSVSTSSGDPTPSKTVAQCRAEITSVKTEWIEDCQEKCVLYGPGGSLANFCAGKNSNASALIACIADLTSYCS